MQGLTEEQQTGLRHLNVSADKEVKDEISSAHWKEEGHGV